MNLLFIKGNPRKNGITEMLCDIFASGIKSAGVIPDEVRLQDLKINPCKGCFVCSNSPVGKCIFNDDMTALKTKLSQADIVVCATPVYFYSMSGAMKDFWDRCFPFICGYQTDSNGNWINKTNFEVNPKVFVSINIGSGRFADTYAPIIATWNAIAKSMGFEIAANIVRSESLYFTHPNQKLEAVRRIKDAIFSAGRELALNGKIEQKTLLAISQNLSESDEVFAYNSNIFWQRLKSGAENITQATNKNNPNDPRIQLAEMQRLFNPQNAPAKATIEFHFSDADISLALKIENGKCDLLDTDIPKHDLKITTTTSSWADFIDGRSRVMEQLARSEIILDGNPHLFTRLKRLFNIEKR